MTDEELKRAEELSAIGIFSFTDRERADACLCLRRLITEVKRLREELQQADIAISTETRACADLAKSLVHASGATVTQVTDAICRAILRRLNR